MRFLHTGDWHLGKTLRGRSRHDEHRGALLQIADAAADANVDAVLVAGDVYDSTMPPADAEALAFEFLARLADRRIACVLIAGNHDHPQKLGALRALLENLHIHVRAEVLRPEAGGVVELASRDGTERALVGALPFVPERSIVTAEAVMAGENEPHARYAARLERVLAALAASFGAGTVNLLLAHVLVAGARFGTGERQLHLGEIFAVHADKLPASATYAALGHLHRPQEIVGAPCRAAYSGSPIELDFGEREQHKRAVLVEARPGLPASLTDVPLSAGRRLLDVRGTLAQLEGERERIVDAFVRATVVVPEPTPGIEERVRAILPDAVEVRQEWPRDSATGAAAAAAAAPRPRDAAELFAAYYRREHDAPPPPAVAELFAAVHRRAQQGDEDA